MKTPAITVPGCGVIIYRNDPDEFGISYTYVSHMMIDGDGVGPSHGDPDYQNTTSYKPNCNSDLDPGFVLPPCAFLGVSGKVLGCKGQIKRLSSELVIAAFPYDVGPHEKIGEAAIYCAKYLGVPWSPVDGGCDDFDFEYTFWPGIAAPGRILQSY